jgi:hypothetical protein
VSRVEELLGAARALEVPPPPPLGVVRQRALEAQAASRRRATWVAFVLALPLGATAAVGVYSYAVRAERPVPQAVPATVKVERSRARAVQVEPAVPDEAPPAAEREQPAGAGSGDRARARDRSRDRETDSQNRTRARGAFPTADLGPEVIQTPEISALPGAAPLTSRLVPETAAVAGPLRTTLADESALLGQALQQLRVARAPERALELLGEYGRRFPNGSLRTEAALAGVEAHRALGEALGGGTRALELKVLRAELQAQLGRCDAALAGLTDLEVPEDLVERARFTQATCAMTLGRRESAVRLLEPLNSPRARELLEQLR